MAIGVILTGSGVSHEQYERVFAAVTASGTPPMGLHSHVAGLSDDGVRIVEIWESHEALQAFFGSKVAPILSNLKVEYRPTFFEVINEFRM